jgi:OmpR family response regulator RpaB
MVDSKAAATQAKVLIIEDDVSMTEALSEYLTQFSFSVQAAHNPETGIELIANNTFDIVLLDIMLPIMNGFELCKHIRTSNDIPIIMLTARDELSDKVVGFEIGADDYLSKPFEPRELVARIQNVLRRHKKNNHSSTRNPSKLNVYIDESIRGIIINDTQVMLTTIEFELLTLLTSKPKQAFSRDQLLQYIKGFSGEVTLETRAIDNAISRLRKKLHRYDPKHQYIQTAWGKGYCFVEPLS